MIPYIALDIMTKTLLFSVYLGYMVSLNIPDTPPTAEPILRILSTYLILKVYVFYRLTILFRRMNTEKYKKTVLLQCSTIRV